MEANPKHEIVVCGVPFETEHEVEALKKLKDIGVTSVQIYTFRTHEFQPEEQGRFDWSHYDREVELVAQAGAQVRALYPDGPPLWGARLVAGFT